MSEERITSRYGGHCRICGLPFTVGTDIFYQKGAGSRHALCDPPEIPADAIDVSRESEPYRLGEIVSRPGQYYSVIACRQRYFAADGMSFGMIENDSGYLYYATCCPASELEAAPHIAAKQQRQAIAAAQRELEALWIDIMKRSSLPRFGPDDRFWNVPTSCEIQIGDGRTVYGGGKWFAVYDGWLMYVLNNSGDGDDWRHNNYSTGGAGAVAWGIPATPELVARVRELVAIVNQPQDSSDLLDLIAHLSAPADH